VRSRDTRCGIRDPELRDLLACPPPYSPDCIGHARWCPQRRGDGLVDAEVKSRAGRRGIVLAEELYELLTLHRTEQDRERQHAGSEWHEGGWIRPAERPSGRPTARLGRLEGAPRGRWRPRGQAPRCAPHGRDGAATPRRARVGRDGLHGLVRQRHASAISTSPQS
jgi:hypothetical protein